MLCEPVDLTWSGHRFHGFSKVAFSISHTVPRGQAKREEGVPCSAWTMEPRSMQYKNTGGRERESERSGYTPKFN